MPPETPSPTRDTAWRVDLHDNGLYADISDAAGKLYATAIEPSVADLIVAVVNERPALLACVEALRGVMRFALPITSHDVDDYDRARAALAALDSALPTEGA